MEELKTRVARGHVLFERGGETVQHDEGCLVILRRGRVRSARVEAF